MRGDWVKIWAQSPPMASMRSMAVWMPPLELTCAPNFTATYEDDGAIRFRMPDEGTTGWDDAVRDRIEFPNEQLDDLVIVRSDGRPTYNFASPVEDVLDGITHVIRGQDHISNTPKQIAIL